MIPIYKALSFIFVIFITQFRRFDEYYYLISGKIETWREMKSQVKVRTLFPGLKI